MRNRSDSQNSKGSKTIIFLIPLRLRDSAIIDNHSQGDILLLTSFFHRKEVVTMKMLLSVIALVSFALATTTVNAEVAETNKLDIGDRMISNEDLQHLELDQDRSTVNEMPKSFDAEGSAPGGVSEDQEQVPDTIDRDHAPDQKDTLKPEDDDSIKDRGGKGPNNYGY
jgi:hypothetical protein